MGKNNFQFQPIESLQISVIDGDRGQHYPKEHEFYEDGYCLFLTAKNVTSSGFQFDEKLFIDKNKDELMRKGRLKRGDIVITTRGTVGNIAYFDENIPFDNLRINSGMAIIRNENSNFDSHFLYSVLKSAIINSQIERLTFGSAQPQLTIGIINSLKLPTPPLPEQKKIAEILSTWDDAIATVSRLIESKRALKKGLMQQLLTGKRRFPGYKEPWKRTNLGELSHFVNGRAFKPRDWGTVGLPIIRIQNLNGSPEYNYFNGEFDEKHLVRDGDLLFSWSGSRGTSFGSFVWKGPDGLLNQHIYKVIPTGVVTQQFFGYLLRYVTVLIERKAHGSAGLVHVTKRELEKFQVRFPTDQDEQLRIAETLSKIDGMISKYESQLNLLTQEKRGLMQKLLTGQVRVKVDEEVSRG